RRLGTTSSATTFAVLAFEQTGQPFSPALVRLWFASLLASAVSSHEHYSGENSPADPSRCSMFRWTFAGRLPCGVAWTAEDTAAPGGTGVAMKAGSSRVLGSRASPTICPC